MVTQSATILERHLMLAGEPPPPLHAADFHKLAAVLSKRKTLTKEDPMSHRIIEKRRRDRMNNCLADLSRLIPADYMKKGRGRIEKTEIIEMAIKHMKHLQDHHTTCPLGGNYEIDNHQSVESEESYSPPESNTPAPAKPLPPALPTQENLALLEVSGGTPQISEEHYRLGYHECLSETMHFLVEVEGMFAGDKLCVQLISHLQRHCDKILKEANSRVLSGPSELFVGLREVVTPPERGNGLNAPRVHNETTSSSSMASKERSSMSGSSSDGGERLGNGNDDGYYNSASQLRDILTSSSLSQSRLKMIVEPASPPSSLNGNSSLADTHSGSLYKFKNNIKQRFSAEHSEQERPLALKRRRSDDRRQPSETSSLPSPPPLKYFPPHSPPSPTPGVPIFALHSKGSFYIPLTVDHNVLTPFLAELTQETNPSSLVLHPVTISVNFQQISRPLKQPLCFSQAAVTWSSSQNNFLLPKWATGDTERN